MLIGRGQAISFRARCINKISQKLFIHWVMGKPKIKLTER